MITRRSFLALLSAVPFVGQYIAALAAGDTVGRSVPAPREVREYASLQDRPGHSVYVCAFGRPTLGAPDCPCKHHEIHRQYINSRIGVGLSTDWMKWMKSL